MDESSFHAKVSELVNEINSIPEPQREKIVKLMKATSDCQSQLKQSVDKLQDSLDYLRMSIKYLLFDVEATRRENACLKKLLEEKNQ